MKTMLIIDIPEEFNDEELSVRYDVIYYPEGHLKEVGIHGKQRLIPLPNTLTNLNLELWNSLEGSIVAPKGMFDEIYNDGYHAGYEDGQKDSLSNIENLTEKAFKDGFEEGMFDELEIDKPLWCPLKPMPEKMDEYKDQRHPSVSTDTGEFSYYARGWNACIDELVGDKE